MKTYENHEGFPHFSGAMATMALQSIQWLLPRLKHAWCQAKSLGITGRHGASEWRNPWGACESNGETISAFRDSDGFRMDSGGRNSAVLQIDRNHFSDQTEASGGKR